MNKPIIEWHDFLNAAPYFQSLVHDVLDDDTDITTLHPLLRALLYFDIFDGEVSNGGIAQYYYNQAFSLPNFERAPEYIAENPVFAPIMHIVNAAHAAWIDCAADVEEAVKQNEWPEQLFNKYAPKFDALQTEFYSLNHLVSQAFCAELIQNPHNYFDFKPIEGLPEKGVAHISSQDNSKHYRFENGFPVGPNVFEKEAGAYLLTRFYNNRSCMEYDDGRRQGIIHYPSKRSISLLFDADNKLNMLQTQFAFWNDHGVRERYTNNQLAYSALVVNKEELSQSWFHPNGQLSLSIEKQPSSEQYTRFWPNGQLNVRYLKDKNGGCRYLQCFAENGNDLAPNGMGDLYELVCDDAQKRIWFTGKLEKCKAVGGIKRNTKYPDQDKIFIEPA